MAQKHVLIVDRDPFSRNLFKTLLEDYGHMVTMAQNVLEAHLILSQTEYDILLIDYGLLGTTGAAELYQLQDNHPSMLIMITSNPREGITSTPAPTSGAQACVARPIDCLEFDQILKGLNIAAGSVFQPSWLK
jgi:two-component system cell cycle response regulator DivK